MSGDGLKIGVVIVTFNHAGYVDGCLGSLERQSYRSFETVVVDNGSTDGTLERLGKFGVHVIENRSNVGFARACNEGARYAFEELGCDHVLLLNPDIEADEGMLAELAASAVAAGDMAVVQGKLMLMRDRGRLNSAGDRLHFLYFGYCGGFGEPDTYHDDVEIGLASGACMLFGRRLLDRLGYLFADEFFMYHEDTDMSARTLLIGGRLVLSARAVAWHDYKFSAGGRKFFHMEKNRLFLMLQNYRPLTLVLLAPAVLFTELQVLLFAALHGWLGWKLKSYLWLAGNMGAVLARRRAVQASRTVGDLEMLGHFVTDISSEAVDNPGLRFVTNPLMRYYHGFVLWALRLLGRP